MEQPDWNEKPLRELMRHIVRRHHGYLRVALPEVHGRMQRVFAAGGGQAAERPLGRVFAEMWDEMDLHLEKEETILFPYIERLEAAREAGKVDLVLAPDGASFVGHPPGYLHGVILFPGSPPTRSSLRSASPWRWYRR